MGHLAVAFLSQSDELLRGSRFSEMDVLGSLLTDRALPSWAYDLCGQPGSSRHFDHDAFGGGFRGSRRWGLSSQVFSTPRLPQRIVDRRRVNGIQCMTIRSKRCQS